MNRTVPDLKAFYLLPQLSDEFDVCIFVDGWLVDNILGSVGVPDEKYYMKDTRLDRSN